MNNKPILFEDKMKYRDNKFLYDKCMKQHNCIIHYQWKMREYKDKINKAIEYILKEYNKYDKGIFTVDQYDQPIYIDEIYGALLNILKGSEE